MSNDKYAALIQVPQFHRFNVLGLTPIERTLLVVESQSYLTDQKIHLWSYSAQSSK